MQAKVGLDLSLRGVEQILVAGTSLEERSDGLLLLAHIAPELRALHRKLQKPMRPTAENLLWAKDFLESIEPETYPDPEVGRQALAGEEQNSRGSFGRAS